MTATLSFRPTKNLLYGDFSDVTPAVGGSYSAAIEGDDVLTTGASASVVPTSMSLARQTHGDGTP